MNDNEDVITHCLSQDNLFRILSNVDYAITLYTYQLPDKCIKYLESSENILNTILNYHIDEENKWRVSKESNVKIEKVGELIKINNKVINEIQWSYAISKFNSLFFISNELNPACVYRLENLVIKRPLLFNLLDISTDLCHYTLSSKLTEIYEN